MSIAVSGGRWIGVGAAAAVVAGTLACVPAPAVAAPAETVRLVTALTADQSDPGDVTGVASFGAAHPGGTFFTANSASNGRSLWMRLADASDPQGTYMVSVRNGAPGGNASDLTPLHGGLYFTADDDGDGHDDLFRTVPDSQLGGLPSALKITGLPSGLDPKQLTPINDAALAFTATTPKSGTELWVSDNTFTFRLQDIDAGSESSNPKDLAVLGHNLIYQASDSFANTEPWATTLNSDNTIDTHKIKEIRPGTGGSDPSGFTVVGDLAYFSAHEPDHGDELWVTDGTDAGTRMVKDIHLGVDDSNPHGFAALNGKIFFAAADSGNVTGGYDYELWRSDGTAKGTVKVADTLPGPATGDPQHLTRSGDQLFFTASGVGTGRELWVTDGTHAGSHLVKDINPGDPPSNPQDLTDLNGTLYFTATDSSGQRGLWRSDGTADGTVPVPLTDVDGGVTLANPRNLSAADGGLYFAATDALHGDQLWQLVDTSAPQISFTSGPADGAHVTAFPVRIDFKADEVGVDFECRVRMTDPDGTDEPVPDYGPCSGPGNAETITDPPAVGTHVRVDIRATDPVGNVGTATTGFEVVDHLRLPAAVDDTATVDHDSAATRIDVLANDTPGDETAPKVESVGGAANGTTAVVEDGAAVTYQPDPGYCNDPSGQPDDFSYTLVGGAVGTVAVTVTCPPPSANDDEFLGVPQDSDGFDLNVLTNDVSYGPVHLQSVTQPDHGATSITDDGFVRFRPAAGFCNDHYDPDVPGATDDPDDPDGTGDAPVTFDYTTDVGTSASVKVWVLCHIDEPPQAVGDTATVDQDSDATTIDVLANDRDEDGGPKAVVSVEQPDHGTAAVVGEVTGATAVSYKPDPGYCNDPGGDPDVFSYTLNGGWTANVEVHVTCSAGTPPTAVDDTVRVDQDSSADNLFVFDNDEDPDGGLAYIDSVTQPEDENGFVVITGIEGGNAPKSLQYWPRPGYCNYPGGQPTRFTYTLNGGSTATVYVRVSCPGTSPTAVADQTQVGQGSDATTIDVLANDQIPDLAAVVESVTQPAHGSVSLVHADGSALEPGEAGAAVAYQPDAGFCGADPFSYTLNGGSSATVAVTVPCGTDVPAGAPTAVAGAATADHTGVNLSWTAPDELGTPALAGYAVTVTDQGSYVGGSGAAAPATQRFDSTDTQQTITGLTAGHRYLFQVAGYVQDGDNLVSGAVSAPSAPVVTASVPAAPTGLSVTAGNGKVDLSWSAPTDDGGLPRSNYLVYRSDTVPGAWTLLTPGPSGLPTGGSFTDTTAMNGHTYFYAVSAVNALGESATSSSSRAVTPSASTSTSLVVDPYPVQVGKQVTWTATVDPAPDGGTVGFAEGESPVSGCAAVPVITSGAGAGKATCTTTYNAVSEHRVVAAFSGTTAFGSSASELATEVVQGGKVDQAIAFPAPIGVTYGDADFAPGATASSGLTVSVVSSTTEVCTVVGGLVHVVHAGSCSLTASQAGDRNTNAAPDMPVSFAIGKAPLTVTAPDASMTFGETPPSVSPSYDGFVGDDTAADLDTAPVCAAHAEAGTSTCSGGVDSDYAFTYVDGHLTVNPVGQQVRLSAPGVVSYAQASVPITASSDSGGAVILSASPARVCTISGARLAIHAAGVCAVRGAQAGDAGHDPASASLVVTVHPAPLRITAAGASAVVKGRLPKVAALFSGFVRGDSVFSLDRQPSCKAVRGKVKRVKRHGKRVTVAKAGHTVCAGAGSGNYAVSYRQGRLGVAKNGYAVTSPGRVYLREGARAVVKLAAVGKKHTFKVTGKLPAGLRLVHNKSWSKVSITGTPTTRGVRTVKVVVRSGKHAKAKQRLSLEID